MKKRCSKELACVVLKYIPDYENALSFLEEFKCVEGTTPRFKTTLELTIGRLEHLIKKREKKQASKAEAA